MAQNQRKRIIRVRVPKVKNFSYKNPEILKKFITEQGTILPRSYTGLSQKMQKRLAVAVKRARHLALLPFTQKV